MELEYLIKLFVPYIVHSLEIVGILIIVISASKGTISYFSNIANPNENKIKLKFAESVALALEFKLASEIIKTVTIRNMSELYVLGAVIILRVVMTFVIQWEIKQDKSQNQNNTRKQKS